MRTLLLVLSIVFVAGTPAKDCVIDVSESMVRRLSESTRSREPCKLMWDNLLLRVRHTHDNLTACQDRDFTANRTEPSTVDCQRQLETTKQKLQSDHNYYIGEITKKIQLNEWETTRYEREKTALLNEIQKINKDFRSMYRDLIFLNIRTGSIKQALKYYHRYLRGKHPVTLLQDLVSWMYLDSAQETERLAQLLAFARHLPNDRVKLNVYNRINTEMKNHPNQRDSYLAMITALDVGRVAFKTLDNLVGRQLYLDIFQPALAYLQRVVELDNYDELVTFATTHPSHFEEIQTRLATMDTSVWNRVNFDRFVTYPNRLPLAKQRLEAFRMLLLQINQRNKSNFADRLVKVARELDQCEAFIRNGRNDPIDLDKLRTVKALFAKLDPKREYDHYLEQAKKQ